MPSDYCPPPCWPPLFTSSLLIVRSAFLTDAFNSPMRKLTLKPKRCCTYLLQERCVKLVLDVVSS